MKPTNDADPKLASELTPTVIAGDLSQPVRGGESLPLVPGYEILGLLGRGGMGVVYRACDLGLQREVAVKILQNYHVGNATSGTRFLEESRITGQLQHPGIPAVHQIGKLADGRPFLAMKLIKGKTLDAVLNERNRIDDPSKSTHVSEMNPWNEASTPIDGDGWINPTVLGQSTIARAESHREQQLNVSLGSSHTPLNYLPIFEAICQAVGYAHAHGVIHRDLKPTNVMVGAFGEVQVMDWGLAKVLTSIATRERQPTDVPNSTEIRSLRDSSETRDGSVMGTPAYMAPEQAAGEIDKIDRRADVFGLGAILCVMLTGRPPYRGPDPGSVHLQALRGNTRDALTALERCGAEPGLVALCRRCLAFEPADRPNDASAVASEVATLRAAADERAKRAEMDRARSEVMVVEQRKRRKVQVALLGLALLLLTGGSAFAWWQDRQANERKSERDRADAERRFTEDQARRGVQAARRLANDLRKQYKFKAAEAALAQATDLARGGIPELQREVEQAQSDLAFVVKLDDIRYGKFIARAGRSGEGEWDTLNAPSHYRRAFAERGLKLESLDLIEAASQIAASEVKTELIEALDDWALYEPAGMSRNDLLEIARRAHPHPWMDRLRDPSVRASKVAIAKLAADVDLNTASPAAIVTLSELMKQVDLDPSSLLASARARHPADFELAFTLGNWETDQSRGQEIGPFEAARAIRPDNQAVLNNLGSSLTGWGNYAGAIAVLTEAVGNNPDLVYSRYNLAVALYKSGDLSGAIAAFKEVLKRDPKFIEAYCALAETLKDNDDLAGAIDACREAVKHDPKSALAHRNLARMLSENADLEGNIASYRVAIQLDPKNALAYNGLGLSLLSKKDINGAIASFRDAIRHKPKFAVAHCNLGIALMEKGERNGVMALFHEAIRLDPRHAEAHYNLGYLLSEKREWHSALACFREAVRYDHKHAMAHHSVGYVLSTMGDLDGAIVAYRETLKIDSKHLPTCIALGYALVETGDNEGAIAVLRKAIQFDPASFHAHNYLGYALQEKGELDAAIAAFRAALQIDDRISSTHTKLGYTLKEKGDLDGAMVALQRAIKLDATAALPHVYVADIQLKRKQYPEALASARTAIRVDPKSSNARAMLSRVLEETGDIAGARAALLEAVRLNPYRWGPELANLPALEMLPLPREMQGP